jgi:uncharacterized protein (TIGR03083 family)
MKPAGPVILIDLFPEIQAELLALLLGLSEEDWHTPTICAGWSVKDISLHLLGDDMGCISRRRDGFRNLSVAPPGALDWAGVVQRVNQANQTWVEAARRISPRLLCELLQYTGGLLDSYWRQLDPLAIGPAVSWAGPQPAPVWLDIAREYTERWLHQQHIRDAVDKPGLMARRFLSPVINTFIWAVPHAYRVVDAPVGTAVKLVITGESGGEWIVLRQPGRWALVQEVGAPCQATITLDQDTAWRRFTRGIGNAQARERSVMEGDQELAEVALDAVSIIA